MRIIPAKMEGLVLQATTPTRVGAWLDSQATDVKVVGILKFSYIADIAIFYFGL